MARPNIAAVAYRTRTVCNTVIKKPTAGITIGRAPVPQGLGVTFCGTGTINGELIGSVPKKTRSRALRINDRGDGTGLDEQGARGATTATTIRFRDFLIVTFRYNHNDDAAMRNITVFGLLGQRFNTMKKQGCVKTTYTDNGFTTHGRIGGGGP